MIAAAPNIYHIHLPQFEGPFDLLLFFIERDELDVHDIPISKITKDFLDYIHRLETMNIEVASEFILVAATLMKIKAKMLLPRPVLKEDGTVEDPRTELVNRLLEYKKYKSVLESLREKEEDSAERLKRIFAKQEEKEILKSDFPEEELMGIDLYTLMRTFSRVWERHQSELARPKHVIRRYPYTLDEVKSTVKARLQTVKKVSFVEFIMEEPNKIFFVFGFLAVLELTQQQHLRIVLGKGFNNFWLVRNDAAA